MKSPLTGTILDIFIKTLFNQLDGWIRRRLRTLQLRSWRKIRELHREYETEEVERNFE